MWEYSWYVQRGGIILIAAILNLLLLKNLMKSFAGNRIWAGVALGSVEAACYLIPYFAAGRIFYIQEMAAGVLLFLLCFALIQKRKGPKNEERVPEKGQMVLLFVIPVTGMLALLCLFLGELKPYIFSALCCGCILAANLSVFYLYHILVQNDAHIRQRDIYRQQTDHYRNQLEVIEESQKRIRSLRHDMKNHMLHLRAQLQQGHCEEALQYLKEMAGELGNPGEHVSCGNQEIDSLLNYKIQKAKQVLTRVECGVHVPVELMPKSFDINVILGNLLDNGIEAAQRSRDKWMKVVIRADKGLLLIHIANSCGEVPRRKGRYGFFSTKEDAGHGIGLENVRRMVERQKGSMEFGCGEGRFFVDVLLYVIEV